MQPLTLGLTATVGVLANPSGDCEPQLLAIEAWAGAQGLRTVDLGTTDQAVDLPEAGGLVIALGGDGTILRALQLAMVHHSPVLGVNFGHLGFLADVDGDDLASALDRIARGEAQIDERTALVATSQMPVPQTVVAFNDLVISRRPGFGSARLHVKVGGEPVLDLTGDGLVVASPTGSTAYTVGAGRPAVLPTPATVDVRTAAGKARLVRTRPRTFYGDLGRR